MPAIALIREGKTPSDERVALTPAQCKWLQKHLPDCTITVQSSATRCFTDKEYEVAGIPVQEDVSHCDIMFGIKEVPVSMLIPDKTYVFFSHTKKKQPYNQALMHAMVDKNITLIDYECLEHEDGQRIIGFGFFAGIVGAHNGIMAYGNRTGKYSLGRVYKSKDYRALIHTYFGLKLPKIKIVVTGSGRVAHGILEIMNLMDVQDVEPDDFLGKEFAYPVYVHLKGAGLYRHKVTGKYNREHFHNYPEEYKCLFENYYPQADILMNGIYWTPEMPRLFEMEALRDKSFRISTIADITDDKNGSVPCNLGDAVISDPVYGVNRQTFEKTAPYLPEGVDVMAVGNLPNELPRDASRYFGEQLIKHVLGDLMKDGNEIIEKATILRKGTLTEHFQYLEDYANH